MNTFHLSTVSLNNGFLFKFGIFDIRMAFVAIGTAIIDGLIIGGLIGGTVLVIGGTIALIKSLFYRHLREMDRIIRLRDETILKLQHQHVESIKNCKRIEKELHRHKEIQEIFKLFELEVEQARKLVEEPEYTDDNGQKIKGFQGKYLSLLSKYLSNNTDRYCKFKYVFRI